MTPHPLPSTPLPVSHQQRLALIEQARKAVLDTRAPQTPPLLAPWVERDVVATSTMRHAIEANQPLLRAAAPVIQSLSRAMAHTRYFAILTDARGRVIDVNGPVDR
ncbi:MAG: histidine kinase, partial [Variovorax sp.]|nr:histidine kinase [Variovorax sp.]